MVELRQIVIAINLSLPVLFWILWGLRSSKKRPFKLTWFRKRLFIGHLLPGGLSLIISQAVEPPFFVINIIVVGILFLKVYLPLYCVLFSDLAYGIAVGRILSETNPRIPGKNNVIKFPMQE